MHDAVWGGDGGAEAGSKFPEMPALGADEERGRWQWRREEGQPGAAGPGPQQMFGRGSEGGPLQPPTV